MNNAERMAAAIREMHGTSRISQPFPLDLVSFAVGFSIALDVARLMPEYAMALQSASRVQPTAEDVEVFRKWAARYPMAACGEREVVRGDD